MRASLLLRVHAGCALIKAAMLAGGLIALAGCTVDQTINGRRSLLPRPGRSTRPTPIGARRRRRALRSRRTGGKRSTIRCSTIWKRARWPATRPCRWSRPEVCSLGAPAETTDSSGAAGRASCRGVSPPTVSRADAPVLPDTGSVASLLVCWLVASIAGAVFHAAVSVS